MSTSALLPSESSTGKLQRKYMSSMLKHMPGIGDVVVRHAEDLADSGLPPVMATALIQAIYAPTNASSRGEANRVGWFVEAIQSRYRDRLDKIRTSPAMFRSFIGEMEEVVQMRDEINDGNINFSYHETFLLWEIGLDADAVCRLLDDESPYRASMRARIIGAAKAVKEGRFTQIETALKTIYPSQYYEF